MPIQLTREQKRRAALQIGKLRREGIERDVAVGKAMAMAREGALDDNGNYRTVKAAREEGSA